MSTKLEQMIEALVSDTQSTPNRNQLLMGLRDALDEVQMSRSALYRALAVEKELSATRAETITHLQETVRIYERTIESLGSQQTQSGALCDKYQPTVRATEYVIDPDYALESDILSKCEWLVYTYDNNGDVVGTLVRVRGQL